MKLPHIFALLALTTVASARPIVVEESVALRAPQAAANVRFGNEVAIYQDWAMVSEARPTPDPAPPDTEVSTRQSVHLYHLLGGVWQYQQKLAERVAGPDSIAHNALAMNDGIASAFGKVYYLNVDHWVEQSGLAGGNGPDMEISGRRIVRSTGDCSFNATVTEPNSNGSWELRSGLSQGYSGCDDENAGGSLDIDGNLIVLADPLGDPTPGVSLYASAAAGSWQLHSRIEQGGSFNPGEHVAIRGDELFVSGYDGSGTYLFSGGRQSHSWSLTQQLRPVNSFMGGGVANTIEKDGSGLIFQSSRNPDRGSNVINVFRKNAAGRYEHVAILAGKNGADLGWRLAVSGRFVIVSSAAHYQNATSDETVRIFELPANIAGASVVVEQFANAAGPAGWQTAGGIFSRALTGGTYVYRQQSTSGDSASVWTTSERTDQSLEVTVRPRGYNGNDRWFGLMARQTDMNNYYYVTLRNSNRIDLKKKVGGVATTLATVPYSITTRTYRLRLESIGTMQRVYLDDKLLLTAYDSSHTHGRVGVVMYKAGADYGNAVLSGSGLATLFADDFNAPDPYDTRSSAWGHTGSGQWVRTGGTAGSASGVYQQNLTTGIARAIVGTPVEDQVIQVRMRATAAAPASGSEVRWFGLMLRYQDDGNYIYVSIRQNNTLSLRELVNGQIRDYGFGAIPGLAWGQWTTLRAEMINNQLHLYVNGADSFYSGNFGPPTGQAGLISWKTAVEFDDFIAYQP